MKTEPVERIILSDGHRLHALGFNLSDDRPPIVLVHGLLMNNGFWSMETIELLCRFGPVLCLSLPGHYPSVAPIPLESRVDDQFFCRHLVCQYTAFFDRPGIWIGHSTGALAAMSVALNSPERVLALGILSTKPNGQEDGGIFGFFQWLHTRLGAMGNRIFGAIIYLNAFSRRFHKYLLSDAARDPARLFAYPGLDRWIDAYLPGQRKLDRHALGAYFKDLYKLDLLPRLNELKMPALMLFGRHDPYVPVESAGQIQAALGSEDKTFHIIEEAAHLYFFEAWDEFSGVLTAWMKHLQNLDRVSSEY